jgi:hypothetical protein
VAENGGTVVKETTPISVDIQGHWEPVNFDITKTSTYDDTLSRREGTKATAHLFIIGKGVNGITRIHQQKPEKRVYPTLDFTSTIPRSFHT